MWIWMRSMRRWRCEDTGNEILGGLHGVLPDSQAFSYSLPSVSSKARHLPLSAPGSQAKRDPNRLAGKPLAVVQYNPQGDLRTLLPEDDRVIPASPNSIIAVSYVRPPGLPQSLTNATSPSWQTPGEVAPCHPDAWSLLQQPRTLAMYRPLKSILSNLTRMHACRRPGRRASGATCAATRPARSARI